MIDESKDFVQIPNHLGIIAGIIDEIEKMNQSS